MLFYAYAAYMLIMNIFAFIIYGRDKKCAVRHRRRIPEWFLFCTALAGGCIGAYLAMRCFHHKTQKGLFAIGVPSFIVLHLFIAIILVEQDIISLPFAF